MKLSRTALQQSLTGLKNIFPQATPSVKGRDDEGGAERVSVVVPGLDKDHLIKIGDMARHTEAPMEIKRSGTTISLRVG